MFKAKQDKCVIVGNAQKFPSINTWVELCDLRAGTAPVVMLHSDPEFGAQMKTAPLMVQELLPHGIYFLNVRFPDHLSYILERGPVGTLIMPELKSVYIDGNDVKFAIESSRKETIAALHKLIEANPEMNFGLGAGNVIGL
jgi:hypothetical protein